LPWVEKHIGLALAESQVAAIRLALLSKVLVMTGGPGVGKTTIVKAILRILPAKGTSLLLCAPTGRAAKRMTEATGFEAKTIHRLLEVDPKTGGFKRSDDYPLHCELLRPPLGLLANAQTCAPLPQMCPSSQCCWSLSRYPHNILPLRPASGFRHIGPRLFLALLSKPAWPERLCAKAEPARLFFRPCPSRPRRRAASRRLGHSRNIAAIVRDANRFAVAPGGLKTGDSFVQNVQASLNLDTGRAGLWSGGLFHFTMQARYGSTPIDTFTVGSTVPQYVGLVLPGPVVVTRYPSIGVLFCAVNHSAVRCCIR